MKLVTKEEMRSIDREATRKYGIPSILLMENAGNAVYHYIKEHIPDYREKRFLIFCGIGNNGGDGAVVARKLFLDDVYVNVVFLKDFSNAGGDNKTNFDIIKNIGVPFNIVSSKEEWSRLRLSLRCFEVMIDAIFGIGFHGEIDGHTASVVDFINSAREDRTCKSFVISLDIPSGVYADCGISKIAVKADTTITFALPKLSMIDFPARNFVGKRVVAKINIPRELLKNRSIKNNLITKTNIKKIFHGRDRDSHKGNYGHLLVIGGSEGLNGAGIIASLSALRAGAGLVTFAVDKESSQFINVSNPEIMLLPLDSEGGLDTIDKFIQKRKINSVLVGNGWGIGAFQKEALSYLFSNPNIEHILIDADGLNNIVNSNSLLSEMKASSKKIVVTPHVKEISRLIGRDTGFVKNFKLDVARDFSSKYNVVTVLKDAMSVIGFPDGQIWVNETGSCALAKGGSGDMLAGIIAGLFTSGYKIETAAILGAFILGRAGEIYENRFSNISAISHDLLSIIPEVFKEIDGFNQ